MYAQTLIQLLWEFKNCYIKSYVDSCDTCAKCKGKYGKCTIGHCKRGKRLFELVFIDFVTMPKSKGKCYILTILDSFSRHFMAIPCTRDQAIDAGRSLYQFFLCYREIPLIVSSERSTHFTSEVYKQFCAQMSTKLAATKLQEYQVATLHNKERPLHAM